MLNKQYSATVKINGLIDCPVGNIVIGCVLLTLQRNTTAEREVLGKT